MNANLAQLKAKRGPNYERWLQALARGVVREHRQLGSQSDEA